VIGKQREKRCVACDAFTRQIITTEFLGGRFALHPPSSLSILYFFSLLNDTSDTSVSNKGNTGVSCCVACCRLCRFGGDVGPRAIERGGTPRERSVGDDEPGRVADEYQTEGLRLRLGWRQAQDLGAG